jgi:outer membrane protein TolC
VGVGALYSRERSVDEPEPIETEHVVGFRVSVPLPVWNNNSGRIREAEAAAVRAAKEVDAVKITAAAEALGARAQMEALARVIDELDRAVLPKAVEIEEQLRNNYTSGLAPVTEVLRARTRRLDLQQQRVDALRDYHLARVRHRAATAAQPAASNPSSFK